MITGRDGAATERVAKEIREEFGTKAIGMSADMAVKDQVEAMVQRAVDEFGGLDTLVTNASSLSDNVLLEHKTDEMLDATLKIGVWGTWWAMRAALPHMKKRGGGSVINFYSIDADTGAWLQRVLRGHLNYYAVPGNQPSVHYFFIRVKRYWLRALRRRSQRHRMSWVRFGELWQRFAPAILLSHDYPALRFDAKTRGRSPVR